MLVAELLAALERRAPAALAEEWDNVGLMVGRHNQRARRMLVALDLRQEVLAEAREMSCDAILVHHPPIFPALGSVTDDTPVGALVLRAAEDRIAVVAAHTNLDAARDGLNDHMARMLGLGDVRPLRPDPTDPDAGLGRVGDLPPAPLGELVRRLAGMFPGPVAHTGDPWARVRTVACCTGSGGSLMDDAAALGADVYVTGDLKYHDADRSGPLSLVHVPHADVEREAMRRWARALQPALAGDGVEVHFARCDTDPWQRA